MGDQSLSGSDLMSTIPQFVKTLQVIPNTKLNILRQIDLCDWEADYHWSQIEYHTRATEYHLEAHDQALDRRRRLQARAMAPVVARCR